jgi:Phage tail tube protein
MAIAGYKVRLRKSGDSTAITAEAMTALSSTAFQITTSARRCLDPYTALHFIDSGTTTLTASTIQFEFGVAHFAAPSAGAVTFYGSYLPLTTSAEDVPSGTQFSLSLTRDLLDTTVFGSAGVRSRIAGLKDAQVSIDMISSPAEYSSMWSLYEAGTSLCLEIDPDGAEGSGEVLRAFGKIESMERSATVDGLVETALSFAVAANFGPSGYAPGYSWG